MTRIKPYLKGLVLIAVLLALGYGVKATGLADLLSEAWIDEQVRDQGLRGDVLFLAVGAVATAVGFPRQAVSFLAGYGFGLGEGIGLALGATVLGCITAFFVSRLIGRAAVAGMLSDRVRRVDEFMGDHPFSMALLLRLMPVGSNLVANLAAGVSGVRAIPFFLGSAIGYIPQTVIFALLGSGVHLDPVLRITTGVVLFVISGMLGIYLFRRYRQSRAMDRELAAAISADPAPGGGAS
ncbi:MAG TPA: VTT domain-containing protein [Alphaproteobacteria bacterium]|nr:VTT domain-containing protein [Alphaproteobacteria bacterium]